MKHFKPTFFLVILSIHCSVFSGFYNISSSDREIEIVPHSAAMIPAAAALAGTIIALVYPQDHELFTDFAKAAEYVQQTVFRTGQAASPCPKPLALLNKPVFGMHVPALMYGKPHNPWQYGPMCATATITDDGSITCTLHNWSIAQQDRRGVCTFQWKELAKTVFDCNQPLLKNFVEAETKKQCTELQRHVNTWPWSLRSTIDAREYDVQQEEAMLRSQAPHYERIFYQHHFGLRALYHMSQKNIAPLFAVHAINHGTCRSFNQSCSLHTDIAHDIVVLSEKRTGKILDVVHCSEVGDLERKREPEEEASITIFDEFTPAVLDGKPISYGSKTVDCLLSQCQRGKSNEGLVQYTKPGNFEIAVLDFYALGVENVVEIPHGLMGFLPHPDGRRILARWYSSNELCDGTRASTLEVQPKPDQKCIKVRYVPVGKVIVQKGRA